MTKGLIFNIQKFSIHDGPGIRTTIFLKGCPLRCKWCANPESQSAHVQILWDQKKCVHCLQCVKSCMHQAISCKEGEIHIDEELCQGCLNCVSTCLQSALSNEGETKEIEEIVRIALQDKDFYEESGGGITIYILRSKQPVIFQKKPFMSWRHSLICSYLMSNTMIPTAILKVPAFTMNELSTT